MPAPITNFDENLYTEEFIKGLYDKGFFQRNNRDKSRKNYNTAKILHDFFKFKSVVDFGCGIGTYLQAFLNEGCEVKGFEYGYEDSKNYMSEKIRNITSFGDVTKRIKLDKKYECALSIEVAEHIPESKSEILVENLVNAAEELIIFSAAPPGQGGTGHINCQPAEFWTTKFEKHGWVLSDEKSEVLKNMTPCNKPQREVHDSSAVWPWVYKNIMFFRRKNNDNN